MRDPLAAIAEERIRLMFIDALLHCLEVTLNHHGEIEICHLSAMHIRELISECTDSLDSVNFR